MNNQQSTRQQRQEREKLLHHYMDAFDRGDFERMAQILSLAEQDLELGELIWEVQAAYVAELEDEQRENDVEVVRQLLQAHMPSAWGATEVEEIPPLTVGDVIARMQADEATRSLTKGEFAHVAQQLRRSSQLLPDDLGLSGVRKLFTRLGVQASRQLQKLFSQTALFLSAGREQGIAQLAATRKQAEQRHFSGKAETKKPERKE
ncbi:MAG TPA: hypothetical protein VFV38_07700 [Ktedonobacteraceae bacterium]|nr:hypothetical protein [Ktedonobacteraceae bacterium]